VKIAIPTHNNQVDDHFGHCENFTVFTVEDKKIVDTEIVPSLQGCGCKSNIVNVLKQKGVELMLAGNMGQGAFNKITFADIKVVRGCSGDIDKLMNDYLAGKVEDSLVMCDHQHAEGHGHQCNH
jgi:predicted Fe-Mo cluster-binding NifX family protein